MTTPTNWPNPERTMRTREEQISQLSCAIFNKRPGDIDECIALARKYILEAEHREEQRVRAEIRRDSERLDWLDGQCVHVYAPKQYTSGIGCGVCLVSHRPGTDRNLRATIDAAREVG